MDVSRQNGRARGVHAERWRSLCASGIYDDVTYKVETNVEGRVVTELPPSLAHRRFQRRLIDLLSRHMEKGEALYEPPVHTHHGTKIPDVVWISDATLQRQVESRGDLPVPEICVEVLSPSNTDAEMEEKRRLYFEIGVREVWLCDQEGRVRFFDPSGERLMSPLCPPMSTHISL